MQHVSFTMAVMWIPLTLHVSLITTQYNAFTTHTYYKLVIHPNLLSVEVLVTPILQTLSNSCGTPLNRWNSTSTSAAVRFVANALHSSRQRSKLPTSMYVAGSPHRFVAQPDAARGLTTASAFLALSLPIHDYQHKLMTSSGRVTEEASSLFGDRRVIVLLSSMG